MKLVTAWGGELTEAEQKIIDDAEFESKNYGEDFMTAGEPGSKYSSITLATREIIAGANEIIGEVRDSKIGAPATGEDVNYIESPFAHNSIVDFYDNIMSCKHALYGGWNVVEQPTATSLLGVCLKVNNADMKAAAQNAQTKLDAALNKISILSYNSIQTRVQRMQWLHLMSWKVHSMHSMEKSRNSQATQHSRLSSRR